MNDDLINATRILHEEGFTCVLCSGDNMYTSKERGVAPLLRWITEKADLHEFSAADKVVGKAAAFLYVILGVREVYAPVMSEAAIYTLARNGIQPFCDVLAKSIRNRDNTGMCPMESAVEAITEPQQALEAIQTKLMQIKSRTQRIAIHYRFAGYIEIPDSAFKGNYTADTRQGVAVEYVPKAIPA